MEPAGGCTPYKMSERFRYEQLPADSDALITSIIADIGDSLPGDPLLRTYNSDSGRLLIIGHCLASEGEVDRATASARASGTIHPLTELAGSYSGVFSTEQDTIVFADLAGQFPLYYRHGEDGMALSTSAQRLAQKYEGEVDRASVAAGIWQGMDQLNKGYSYFQNIHQLTGGEFLQISRGSIVRKAYETFTARPDVDFFTAAEMTRNSLTEAIQRRLNTERLTSDFSGGHDSTSLAMLAASLGGQSVPSLVQHNTQYPAGDIKHARRLAALHPGIVLQELVDGPEEMSYAILDPAAIPYLHDAPPLIAEAIGRARQRWRAVGESGSTLHLQGIGGDALYDGFPSLADLLQRGETGKAWKQAILSARMSLGNSPQQWIDSAERQQNISLSQAHEALADVCREPAKRLNYSTGWIYRPSANLQWLTPEMRELLATRAEAHAEHANQQLSRGEYSTAEGIYANGRFHLQTYQTGGAIYHAPFLDHAVIRAATQLELSERAPIGTFKPLLRKALAGYGVLREVFERTSKGNYSPVADAELLRARGAVLGLLDSSRLAAMGIIDPRAVRQSIEDWGLTNERTYVEAFVAAEIWMRQRELFEETGVVELQTPKLPTIKEVTVGPEVAEILAQRYAISSDMVFASGPVQMLALNMCTGTYATLNSTAVRILQAMANGDAQAAVQSLAAVFPGTDPGQLCIDVADTITSFKEQGIVVDWSMHRGPSSAELPEWPAPNSDRSPDIGYYRIPPLRPTEQLVFSDGEASLRREVLRQAYELGEQGLAATIRFLKGVSPSESHLANAEMVRRDMVHIRQLSLGSSHNNQRIACYESSLAAKLLATKRGQQVSWCIGVAFRPGPSLHAWIEVDNKPVLISTDETIEGVYQPLLKL